MYTKKGILSTFQLYVSLAIDMKNEWSELLVQWKKKMKGPISQF